MIRTILWALCALILCVLFLPVVFVMKLVSLFKTDRRFPGTCQMLADIAVPVLLKTAGVQFEIEGAENLSDGPALYTGNHQGAFDAFIPVACLGPLKSIIMKKEIEKFPFAGWALRFFGCIFLDRSSLKASMKCIDDVETELKQGGSVAVFPEGTRSRGADVAAFHPGTFRSAIRAGVPIIPFAVDGSYRCFETTGQITPGRIRLSILPPVRTDAMDVTQTRELCSRIENSVREEVKRLQARS